MMGCRKIVSNKCLVIVLVSLLLVFLSGCAVVDLNKEDEQVEQSSTFATQSAHPTRELISVVPVLGTGPTTSSAPDLSIPAKVEHWDWLVPDDFSLADALQVASFGDVIRVRAGIYSSADIGKVEYPITEGITIVGDGLDKTVLHCRLSSVTLMYLTVDSATRCSMQYVHASRAAGGDIRDSIVDTLPPCKDLSVERSVVRVEGNTSGFTGTLKITNSTVLGRLVVGHTDTLYPEYCDGIIAYNTFADVLELALVRSSFTVDSNSFLLGVNGVWISNKGDVNWANNYWAGWDVSLPVPINGLGKAVDRKPSDKSLADSATRGSVTALAQ